MLTVEEIYQRIGLEDPEVFAKRMRATNEARIRQGYYNTAQDNLERGSGRTTRMIAEALVFVSMGKPVMLKTRHRDSDELVALRARRWCVILGLDASLINKKITDGVEITFTDHAL